MVAICAASDAVLIIAGVAGLGFVISAAPWLVVAARWAGALFLLGYGLLAARRAWKGTGEALQVDAGDSVSVVERAERDETRTTATMTATRTSLAPVILTVLALTWLNPHVYLDTVLMLGSISATHGEDRWLFAAGAVVASILWFTALGFGARYLGRWLRTPRSWRILDAIIAVVMIVLAISLVLPVLNP